MSPHELKAFEAALKGLVPSSPAINRDQLMYRAGRASARGSGGWQTATVILSCTVVALGAMWAVRARPEPGPPRVVYLRVPAQPSAPPPSLPVDPPPAEEPSPTFTVSTTTDPIPRYRQVQENVMRWGLYGLPAPPRLPRPDEARSLDAMLDSL